ncbi:MAG: primosomal protein N' [Chloroflexi bacterium]|nr:primosomal protein N' [Chloroflexota bacterium]
MYAEIAVNVPNLQITFHYAIPPHLSDRLRAGHLVTVPFGFQRAQGIVVGFAEEPAVPEVKPIEDLIDPDPVLTQAQLDLAYWLSHTYLARLNECLTLMLPPGLSKRADVLYELTDKDAPLNTPAQKTVVRLLEERGPLRGNQLDRALPRTNWRNAVASLVKRGRIKRQSVLDPPSVRAKQVRTARLTSVGADFLAGPADTTPLGQRTSQKANRLIAILDYLREEGGGPIEVSWIYASTTATLPDLKTLAERDLVDLGTMEALRDPLADLDFVPTQAPRLTVDQQRVWGEIEKGLGIRDYGNGSQPLTPNPYLLHGVTGSGKTEIYLRAVGHTLAAGRRAIVLVPEIALTPQTVRRFVSRFPGRVAVIHSQLSDGERYDTWRRARAGAIDVIVGARSALFAPLSDIGLIVLDEEHDEAYKQDPPRNVPYHARDSAAEYARRLGAVCILGSATPDLVSYHRAEQGAYRLLELPQRIMGHGRRIADQARRLNIAAPKYRPLDDEESLTIDLPDVSIVDMRQELRAGNSSMFSRALHTAMAETLERGEQMILFLNRRGTATHVFCRDCGFVLTCSRCDTPLTHHEAGAQLICHHCNYRRPPPQKCPNCGRERIRHFGAGTQKVEAAVVAQFPKARTLRWDADTARAKGAHDLILQQFVNRQADVLIGTQMIAKGLDFPLVTLVGVISADTGLALPDYRAAERTFQIVTQVVGRAGRGLLGGRAIIQTYNPDHYAIQAAARHDYAAFYRRELAIRREYGYPPFSRLVRLTYRSPYADRAENEAGVVARQMQYRIERAERSATTVVGPAPCFFGKISGEYRWQVILRGPDPASLVRAEVPKGWRVEVDPLSTL